MKKILLTLLMIMTSSLAEARDCTSENKFITLDKKQKKEMKKKPMGHYLVSYSCFNYYHPEIVKYIDSRL